MKVEFIGFTHMSTYRRPGLVMERGDVRDLPTALAKTLLERFPEAFRKVAARPKKKEEG